MKELRAVAPPRSSTSWQAALVLLFLRPLMAVPAAAQTPATEAALMSAAATITAAELQRHVDILGADSLRGRATPSPALDRAAAYVAAQLQQLGVQSSPKGWIWRYLVPGQLRLAHYPNAFVGFAASPVGRGKRVVDEVGQERSQEVRLRFDSTLTMYFARETGAPMLGDLAPEKSWPPLWVLAGPQTAASVPLDSVRDKVVLYIPAATADSATRQQVLAVLYQHTNGVVVLSDLDSARFAAAAAADRHRPVPIVDPFLEGARGPRWPWAIVLRPEALGDLWSIAGVDIARLRVDSAPVARELSGLEMRFVLDLNQSNLTASRQSSRPPLQTAPNVVGLVEGTDSVLKDSYILISASLDAGGARPDRADSVDPGADDNAAGTAGLLALAQAFSQPGARPRRSLVFLATSGGAAGKDAWGSNAYALAESRGEGGWEGRVVAALHLDRIDGRAGDLLWLAGLGELDLGWQPDWVVAAHPELQLAVLDGGTVFRPSAEYFPFVRLAIPTLSFHGGTHDGPRGGVDAGAGLPAERSARLLQYVFYLTAKLADAERNPRWSAAGRRQRAAMSDR